jgi:hypothetical protein
LDSDPRRPCDEGGSSLGLGELAQLTVSNDIESAFNVSLNNLLIINDIVVQYIYQLHIMIDIHIYHDFI